MTPKKLFNLFAKSEAVTWALLLSGLAARALTEMSPIVLTIVGSLHGLVFLGYGVTAALVGINQRWGFAQTAIGIVLAIVPFATVPFEKRKLKSGALEGAWRTAEGNQTNKSGLIERLFLFFIARPLVLILVLVIAVFAVFSFLLWLGPPDQWFDRE